MKILVWIAAGVAILSVIISIILYISAVRQTNQANSDANEQTGE